MVESLGRVPESLDTLQCLPRLICESVLPLEEHGHAECDDGVQELHGDGCPHAGKVLLTR